LGEYTRGVAHVRAGAVVHDPIAATLILVGCRRAVERGVEAERGSRLLQRVGVQVDEGPRMGGRTEHWLVHRVRTKGHLPGLDQPGPGIGGSTPHCMWSAAGLGLMRPRFPVGVGTSRVIIGLPLLVLVAVVLGRGEGRRGRRLVVGGALGWLRRGRLGASEEGSSRLHLGCVCLPAFILNLELRPRRAFTTMDGSEMG
jgi:hypothetical protein